jgi:membrane protease YdiL (CAAX protease family)
MTATARARIRAPARPGLRPLAFAGVVAAVAAAEALVSSGAVRAAVVLDAALAFALVNAALLAARPADRRLLSVLALVPEMRLLSFVMPLHGVPRLFWPALVGAPLLAATLVAARTLAIPLAPAIWPARATDLLVAALGGVGLSLLAYAIAAPAPQHLPVWAALLTPVVITGLIALPEELLFRGLLQSAGVRALGTPAIVLVNGLYGATYLGAPSPLFTAFLVVVGLAFSYALLLGRSLAEVVTAHAALQFCLVLAWPLLLG